MPTLATKSRSASKRSLRSECLAAKTVLTVARQRNGFDAKRCETLLKYLDAAEAVRSALLRPLNANGLTELQFFILVALFTLEPEPASPADLAVYTAVSRAAVTEALAKLERAGAVTRTRDERDLRVFHLRMTDLGRQLVDQTLVGYLHAGTQMGQALSDQDQDTLLTTAAQLHESAENLRSEPASAESA